MNSTMTEMVQNDGELQMQLANLQMTFTDFIQFPLSRNRNTTTVICSVCDESEAQPGETSMFPVIRKSRNGVPVSFYDNFRNQLVGYGLEFNCCTNCASELQMMKNLEDQINYLGTQIKEVQGNLLGIHVKAKLKAIQSQNQSIPKLEETVINQLAQCWRLRLHRQVLQQKLNQNQELNNSTMLSLGIGISERVSVQENNPETSVGICQTQHETSASFGNGLQEIKIDPGDLCLTLEEEIEDSRLQFQLNNLSPDEPSPEPPKAKKRRTIRTKRGSSNQLNRLSPEESSPEPPKAKRRRGASRGKPVNTCPNNPKRTKRARRGSSLDKTKTEQVEPPNAKASPHSPVSPHIYKHGCAYGCEAKFRRPYLQRKHYFTKHSEAHAKNNPHHCRRCFKVFPDQVAVGLHNGKCKGIRINNSYTCEVCGKVYTSKENYDNHKYDHVSVSKRLCCHLCGKTYIKPLAFKEHIRTHMRATAKGQRVCEYCGKQSHYRTHRFHLYQAHKEEYLKDKPFYCTICHHAFITQEELNIHLNRHPKCQYCDHRFIDKIKVAAHENFHTKSQPHHCSVCGKRFSQDANLRTHMKIHTGERPHHCEICPEKPGFFRRRELEKHVAKLHPTTT